MNGLFSILWHIVFTVNMLGLMVMAGWAVWHKCMPDNSAARRRFVMLAVAVVLIKALYILFYIQVNPERIFSTDGERYFGEIQNISIAPWFWNPIEGTGPRYSASAKMGMSYIYGLILFAHRINSLYGVLVLNLVAGYLTCLLVLLITLRISDYVNDALLAFFLAGVYPETLFWNARVVRENVTLLLVPLLVYAAIRLKETYRLRYLAIALLSTFLLALTRAQLSLLFLLIVIYFGIVAIGQSDRRRTLVIALFLAGIGVLLRNFMEAQIKAAIGTDLLRYITIRPAFWLPRLGSFVTHAPQLLTVYARKDHGVMGILLAPVFIMVMALFVLTAVRFERIYHKNRFAAGLMIFLAVTFLFAVATFGLINIRFRATVAPLVVSLVSVTAGYYWRSLQLPSLSVFRCRASLS